MSSDEDDMQDGDSCGYGEIMSQFTKWLKIDEKKIPESSYALHLAADKSFRKTAVGTSQGSVHIYELAAAQLVSATKLEIECFKNETISGVEFAKENFNLLYVGTTQGFINVYDLRVNQKIYTCYEQVKEKIIPISCFDINSNDRIMCAGSEKILNDAFIIFFDTRQRKSLGIYCESHDDDLTSVKFHPNHPDYLLSGSTDGLINIFDISNSNEDDALTTVINSESSVRKLNWHNQGNGKYVISCIMHTDDFKLYDSAEGDLICEYSRTHISNSVRRKTPNFCDAINCHSKSDGNLLLLAGSSYKDNILRSVLVNTNKLKPCGNYEGNRQTVRTSVSNENANIMLTAGENAMVNLWHEIAPSLEKEDFKIKGRKGSKSHNKKPY